MVPRSHALPLAEFEVPRWRYFHPPNFPAILTTVSSVPQPGHILCLLGFHGPAVDLGVHYAWDSGQRTASPLLEQQAVQLLVQCALLVVLHSGPDCSPALEWDSASNVLSGQYGEDDGDDHDQWGCSGSGNLLVGHCGEQADPDVGQLLL